MRRRALLTALGTAALAASVLLALLGRAVLATPTAVSRATADWPDTAPVVEGTALQDRAARYLLAAGREERLLAIARAYRRAALSPATDVTSATPLRLAELARGLPRQERAQAHVMVGAVYALPAGTGGVSFDVVRQLGGGRLLQQAADEFRAAASLDDRNEAAKYDLELLLKADAQSRSAQRSKRAAHRSRRQASRRQTRQHRRTPRSARFTRGAAPQRTGSGY